MRWLLTILCIIVVLNLLALDVVLIQNIKSTSRKSTEAVNYSPNTLGTTTATVCPQSCITKINQAVSAAKLSASPAKISSVTTSASSAVSKEYFIPIGSGSGAGGDWEDVPGLQIEIDPARYGTIKNAYFEASVHVPNANQIVFVRLYNVTDKHTVWFSELSFNNAGTAQSQTSPSITLGTGQKAYKVQMKTQLKFTTNVTSSRLRILTQ